MLFEIVGKSDSECGCLNRLHRDLRCFIMTSVSRRGFFSFQHLPPLIQLVSMANLIVLHFEGSELESELKLQPV